jgi:hypothetical protein
MEHCPPAPAMTPEQGQAVKQLKTQARAYDGIELGTVSVCGFVEVPS